MSGVKQEIFCTTRVLLQISLAAGSFLLPASIFSSAYSHTQTTAHLQGLRLHIHILSNSVINNTYI